MIGAGQAVQIQPEVVEKIGKLFGEDLSNDACTREAQTPPGKSFKETGNPDLEEDVHQGLQSILSAQPFLFRGRMI